MLNIYKYYTEPSSLPMSEIRGAVSLLQSPQTWEAATKHHLEQVIHIVAKDPKAAYRYIIMFGNFERWPEAEPAIATNAHSSYEYALRIIKGRFEKGEAIISSEPFYAVLYAQNILAKDSSWPYKNGRWPEAEKVMIKSIEEYTQVDAEDQACRYAIKVIGSRWLEVEPYLKNNSYVWNEYKTHFGIE